MLKDVDSVHQLHNGHRSLAMTLFISADEAFEDDDHTVMVMDMGQVTVLSGELVPASYSYR